MQLLFHDRHQYVNADRNPDLRFYCVITCAVKVFDAQVLLNYLKNNSTFQRFL